MKKPKLEVELQLQALNSPDWKARRDAAQALGLSRDMQAVEPLIAVLNTDKSWTVRSRAAVALGRLRDERAIEPLIEVMKNGANWQLHKHSFNAVVKFGEVAVPLLNKHSQDESCTSFVRSSLVNAMGSIGAEGSLFALSQKLYDRDVAVRIQAVYALAQLKSATVVDKLIQVLEDPKPVPKMEADDNMLAELRAMQNPKPYVFKAVAEALAVLNNRRAVEPLVNLFRPDVEPFGPETEMLMAATNALRQLGGVNTRDFDLLSTLLSDDDAVTRAAAALSLSWLQNERALDLLYGATRDTEPYVRRAAQWSLGALQIVLGYGVPVNPTMVAHILR